MKSRLSYFLILGIIISVVFTVTIIWKNNHFNEISKLSKESFTTPISSKYIPANSDLVFHWKVNPNELPNYVENFQDKINKNIINTKIKLFRDTSFELINLDFSRDISKWAGSYGSFAIFDKNDQLFNDWLIILEVNKDVNIDKELESITNPIITEENIKSNNKLNNAKSQIISKEINSNQSIYFSNQNGNMLISSNPKIIKSSINQARYDQFSLREKYKNIQLKNYINDGIFLLEMSPKKIFNLIGQSEDLLEINQADKLISSLNIDKNKLIFEGILSYDIKNKRPINDLNSDFTDIEKEFNLFDNFIFIDNPKNYSGKNSNHPYKKFIESVIQKSLTEDFSNLFNIILENTKGNLIGLKDQEWLAIARKTDTDKKDINEILEKDKFSNTKFEFKNKNLEVWSKITTNSDEKYEIKDNIEAITEETKNVYIWSKDLSSISNFDNTKYLLNSIDTDQKENENIDFDEIIKLHLGIKETKVFLNNFYPYTLLRTILGNKLDFPKNIDILVAIPTINYPDYVKFIIKLKTS